MRRRNEWKEEDDLVSSSSFRMHEKKTMSGCLLTFLFNRLDSRRGTVVPTLYRKLVIFLQSSFSYLNWILKNPISVVSIHIFELLIKHESRMQYF